MKRQDHNIGGACPLCMNRRWRRQPGRPRTETVRVLAGEDARATRLQDYRLGCSVNPRSIADLF